MNKKQQNVLNAATGLFAEYGFTKVGIDSIVAASDVSKMTLYKYFKSKDDLIRAVLEQRDEALRASILEALAGIDEPLGRIKAVFDWYDAWFQTDDFHGCMFIKASEEYAGLKPAIMAVTRQHKEWLRAILRDALNALAIADSDAMAAVIMSYLDGLTVTMNMYGAQAPISTEEAWGYMHNLLMMQITQKEAV